MTTESDPLATREYETSMAAVIITQGAIVGFLALVGVILTAVKGASWSLVVLGGVFAALLLASGAWLWRRRKRPSASRLGSRLAFWSAYAPVTAMSGLNYLTSRTWPRLAFFLITLSLAGWFYSRFVLRRRTR